MITNRSRVGARYQRATRRGKKEESSSLSTGAAGWRMLDRTVQGIKDRNQDVSAKELQGLIDQAVRDVRSTRTTRVASARKARTRSRK